MEILADGDWHTLGEMTAGCSVLIPPERAYRAYATGHGRMAAEVPFADMVLGGRRKKVAKVLWNLGLEVEHDGTPAGLSRRYRLRPGNVVAFRPKEAAS